MEMTATAMTIEADESGNSAHCAVGRIITVPHPPTGPRTTRKSVLYALFRRRVAVPPPGAPHLFKYAEAGTLSAELATVGFQQIEESFRALTLPFPSTPEEQWELFFGGSAPFHPIINSLSSEEREQAIGEVLAGFRQCYDGEYVRTAATMVIASGVR
ncbi:MAG: hypothetical protein M3008_09460 [Chloroflexota bacterium]|nr:hypothetical protein [Chloroflexota bacterium]